MLFLLFLQKLICNIQFLIFASSPSFNLIHLLIFPFSFFDYIFLKISPKHNLKFSLSFDFWPLWVTICETTTTNQFLSLSITKPLNICHRHRVSDFWPPFSAMSMISNHHSSLGRRYSATVLCRDNDFQALFYVYNKTPLSFWSSLPWGDFWSLCAAFLHREWQFTARMHMELLSQAWCRVRCLWVW